MTPSLMTPHFSYTELVTSPTALRLGIDNTPNQAQTSNLARLSDVLLEPARVLLGVPMHVNSGYRSRALNARIGGAVASAHMDGRACDFVPVGLSLRVAFETLRTSDLPYDQIIIECNAWIHIAIAPADRQPRREALTASGSPGHWTYEAVAHG